MKITQNDINKFMYGDCIPLAMALFRMTKYPIYFIGKGKPFKVQHAFVKISENVGLDIKGIRKILEIKKDFNVDVIKKASYKDAQIQYGFDEPKDYVIDMAKKLLKTVNL